MFRLGIVDFDTSHVVEFTKRFNHVDSAEDQWVEGARVVVGCPGSSKIAPDRVPGYTEQMKKYGVPLVDKPEDMLGKIDAVLVESLAGDPHLERVRPFLERGIPAYVDKPFACRSADAKEMVRLAQTHHVPIFSSSSLRYAPEVVEAAEGKAATGRVLGAHTYGPAPLDPGNPGLFHYGIHPVEMLYALMGPGCRWLSCVKDVGGEAATGYWEDGRIGSVRGIRSGASAYGFTVFGDKAVAQRGVSAQYIYRELLKQIVSMLEKREAPIAPEVTLEIVAFIVAALESGDHHGRPVEIMG
ncbi:MAG: Gfo/Idh/MocA family oxidoreductase [Planctomycetes bacterium]|nr:Gfo/Idh/MocA family oxidoreductase [Planctomycetota bacterium]